MARRWFQSHQKMATTKDNLSVVLHGVNDLRLEMTEMPEPGDLDVMIRMSCVGICGTDIHFLSDGRIGDFVIDAPLILGHESSGTVVKCGSKVTHLKPGDRVAIEPAISCRYCNVCKTGRYNMCKNVLGNGMPPDHGNLRQYYVHPADYCFKLPDNVSMEEGAIVEPLAVGVHAATRAGVKLGSKVLICGAGPIGLVSMITARFMGATHICCTDINEGRLRFARKMGADSTVLVKKESKEEDLVNSITEAMGGSHPNFTFECSGAEASIRLSILATESGGVVVLVGLGPDEVKIPIVSAAIREVDIKGVFRYANSYPPAIEMLASGRVDVKPLITHRFKMRDALQAFETVRRGEGSPVKVLIHVEE